MRLCCGYIFILQVSRHQTQFEATLTDKLARLAPEVAEQAEEAAPKEGAGWFGR